MTQHHVIQSAISAEKMTQKQGLSLYSAFTGLLDKISGSLSWVKPALRLAGSSVWLFSHFILLVLQSRILHTPSWGLVLATMFRDEAFPTQMSYLNNDLCISKIFLPKHQLHSIIRVKGFCTFPSSL